MKVGNAEPVAPRIKHTMVDAGFCSAKKEDVSVSYDSGTASGTDQSMGSAFDGFIAYSIEHEECVAPEKRYAGEIERT